MDFVAFYPDGTRIQSAKDFVDYYSKFYYYNNSIFIESEIEKILYNGIKNTKDVAKILAWKIGKIRHHESECKKDFVFSEGWENALENLNGKIYKDSFDFNELAKYIATNIIELENEATTNPQTVLDKLNACNTKYIGSVYLITLLFFISRGKYPIYDRFAYKAIRAIKSGKYPSNIPEKKLPEKGSTAFSKLFESDSIYSKYIRHIEDLRKKLGKEYQNNRKIDQALWTYGHIIINDFHNIHFERKTGNGLSSVKRYGYENAEKINAFHKSFPEYSFTPLRELKNLAADLGVKNIYVKDESYRFGLNAFKVLGGSYAIGNYIARKLGMNISELSYGKITSDEIKAQLGETTFVTATDGNHGRGVAWTANRLGQKSVVFMPKGTAPERLENIKNLGSDASITDLFYDDDVRLAKECSEKYGWIVVQDTSWDGYEDVPADIMEGYTTIGYEIINQLEGVKPTHIFLQAGVGSMAGAICGFFADYYGDENRPVITIVEPNAADCIYRTAEANDGKLHFTQGDMNSMMAGLCCGEPCKLAWDVLRDHADNFVAMPEYPAATGMRILGKPLGDDAKIISGESGASTIGLVTELMRDNSLEKIRKEIGLDKNSVVLCISTEGDTDKENYRKILSE